MSEVGISGFLKLHVSSGAPPAVKKEMEKQLISENVKCEFDVRVE